MITRIGRIIRASAMVATLSAAITAPAAGQAPAVFSACYVPAVGALYMIKQQGLPQACLSTAHAEVSWKDGGGELADGAVLTVKLANGAVTTVKIADGAITPAKLSFEAATKADLSDHAASLRLQGTINDPANPIDWSRIRNVPAGLADGVDNDGTADGSITAAKLADGSVTASKLAPDAITNAAVAVAAGIAESKLALNFATHSNVNDPDAGQKAALLGTALVPSGANRYVTDADPRNVNARAPTVHGDVAHDGTVASLVSGRVPASELGTGTASTSTFLRGDRTWVVPSPFIRRTIIPYNGVVSDASPSSTPEQLRVIGSFTKVSATSVVEIVWNSHVTGGGVCNFHIRVNGAAAPTDPSGAVVRITDGQYSPVSTLGFFGNLAAGTHSVSLWVRGVDATVCMDNPGNYTRQVMVTEYQP